MKKLLLAFTILFLSLPAHAALRGVASPVFKSLNVDLTDSTPDFDAYMSSDVTISSGSTSLAVPNSTLTSSMNGWKFKVCNKPHYDPGTGYQELSNCIASGTFSSVTGAHAVTLSSAATQTCASGQCNLYYGKCSGNADLLNPVISTYLSNNYSQYVKFLLSKPASLSGSNTTRYLCVDKPLEFSGPSLAMGIIDFDMPLLNMVGDGTSTDTLAYITSTNGVNIERLNQQLAGGTGIANGKSTSYYAGGHVNNLFTSGGGLGSGQWYLNIGSNWWMLDNILGTSGYGLNVDGTDVHAGKVHVSDIVYGLVSTSGGNSIADLQCDSIVGGSCLKLRNGWTANFNAYSCGGATAVTTSLIDLSSTNQDLNITGRARATGGNVVNFASTSPQNVKINVDASGTTYGCVKQEYTNGVVYNVTGTPAGNTSINLNLASTVTGYTGTVVGDLHLSTPATTTSFKNGTLSFITTATGVTGTSFDTSLVTGAYKIAGSTILQQPASDTTSVALGVSALGALSSTNRYNVALGNNALSTSTSGTSNVAVGMDALKNNKGNNNIAIGSGVVSSSTATAGNANVVIGKGAGNILNSNNNVILGYQVGSKTLTIGSSNILIGTSSLIDTTASSTTSFLNIGNLYEGDLSKYHATITNGIDGGGTPPTVSTCGNGPPAVSGNDNVMLITTGTNSPTACTVTFAQPWVTIPVCNCTPWANVTNYLSATSTAAFTITLSSAANSAKIGCQCLGYKL